jgi:hypothetical protein
MIRREDSDFGWHEQCNARRPGQGKVRSTYAGRGIVGRSQGRAQSIAQPSKAKHTTLARSQSAAARSSQPASQPAQQLATPTATAEAEAQHARTQGSGVVWQWWCGAVRFRCTRYVRQVLWELGRNKGIAGLDVGDGASRGLGGVGEGEDWQWTRGTKGRGDHWTALAGRACPLTYLEIPRDDDEEEKKKKGTLLVGLLVFLGVQIVAVICRGCSSRCRELARGLSLFLMQQAISAGM